MKAPEGYRELNKGEIVKGGDILSTGEIAYDSVGDDYNPINHHLGRFRKIEETKMVTQFSVNTHGDEDVLKLLIKYAKAAGYNGGPLSAKTYPYFVCVPKDFHYAGNFTNQSSWKLIPIDQAIEFFKNPPKKKELEIQGHKVVVEGNSVKIGCKTPTKARILRVDELLRGLSLENVSVGNLMYGDIVFTHEDVSKLVEFIKE